MAQKYSKKVIADDKSSGAFLRGPTHKKHRNYVFTYYPEYEGEEIYNEAEMRYCYYGIEKCPSTGKLHYQGWCVFHNERSEIAVCKKYGCYFRIMEGKFKHNYKYCSKDNNVKEFGEPPCQGKRNDLKQYADDIREGIITIEDILIDDPIIYHKYGRTLEKIQNLVYKERTEKPEVHWYYGKGGCGKTRQAIDQHPDYYQKESRNIWWDGYKQQHTIIIDDFRKDDMPFNTLLKILDRYKYQGEIKGGHIHINSPLIIITSDEGPHHFWQGNDLVQIRRRIDVIKYFE